MSRKDGGKSGTDSGSAMVPSPRLAVTHRSRARVSASRVPGRERRKGERERE